MFIQFSQRELSHLFRPEIGGTVKVLGRFSVFSIRSEGNSKSEILGAGWRPSKLHDCLKFEDCRFSPSLAHCCDSEHFMCPAFHSALLLLPVIERDFMRRRHLFQTVQCEKRISICLSQQLGAVWPVGEVIGNLGSQSQKSIEVVRSIDQGLSASAQRAVEVSEPLVSMHLVLIGDAEER